MVMLAQRSTGFVIVALVSGCSTIGGIEPGHLSEQRGMSEEEIAAAEQGPMVDPTATEAKPASPTPPQGNGSPPAAPTSNGAPGPTSKPASSDAGALACPPGFADCNMDPSDGCESNLVFSTMSCGACGNTCANVDNTIARCSEGQCAYRCAGTFMDCDGDMSNGCESDIRFDDANCGVCGRACDAGRTCTNGACL